MSATRTASHPAPITSRTSTTRSAQYLAVFDTYITYTDTDTRDSPVMILRNPFRSTMPPSDPRWTVLKGTLAHHSKNLFEEQSGINAGTECKPPSSLNSDSEPTPGAILEKACAAASEPFLSGCKAKYVYHTSPKAYLRALFREGASAARHRRTSGSSLFSTPVLCVTDYDWEPKVDVTHVSERSTGETLMQLGVTDPSLLSVPAVGWRGSFNTSFPENADGTVGSLEYDYEDEDKEEDEASS